MEWLIRASSPYFEAVEGAGGLASLPLYTSGGKWVTGKGWSNGFAIGVYLLACRLMRQAIDVQKLDRSLDELTAHMASPRFQDVGFIALYSCVLASELGMQQDKRVSACAAYLSQCVCDDGAMHVEWRPECRISLDQFMNSMLLGWVVLNSGARVTATFSVYTAVVEKAAAELLVQGRVFEYKEHDGMPLNYNAGSLTRCWLRGQAWAMVGLAYAVYVYKTLSIDDAKLTRHLLDSVDVMLDALAAFGRLPAAFASDGSEACPLQDTSAEAAIACALLFLKKRGVLSTDSTERLLLYTADRLRANLCLNGYILSNVSYPRRLISRPGESSAWGDYFALRYLLESDSNEESRISII